MIFLFALPFLPAGNAESIPDGTADATLQLLSWTQGKTWDGTTLFGDKTNGRIVEVNMEGEVVWKYDVPGGPGTAVGGVMVLPNNNVLFAVLNPESRRGAYEVNRQGQVVWQFVDKRVSHDAVRLLNGNTLLSAAHSEDYSAWPYSDPQVFEVNSQGAMVWSFAFKSVYENDPAYKDIRTTDFGPWTHVNGAIRLPNGNTLMSPRNFGITVEVDANGNVVKEHGEDCTNCPPFVPPDNTCALQARRFQCPHSPVPLPNGRLLVNEPIPTSRVMEYDLAQKKVLWFYDQGTKAQNGEWMMVRGSQRLPNGNTLVTDSHGQLLEVTSDKQVVWKLRLLTYQRAGVEEAPFFQAERIGYKSPQVTIQSPQSSARAGAILLQITEGADVGTIRYSLQDKATNVWIVQNATHLRNVWSDGLTLARKEQGNGTLNLAAGTYRLVVSVDSAGWGYKDYLTPKRINHASLEVNFTVEVATQTSSTMTTSSPASASDETERKGPGRTPNVGVILTFLLLSAVAYLPRRH